MKKNICVTGLLSNYVEDITKELADDFDLFYANVVKMLEFDIIDIHNTISICGLEYYKKLLFKKIKELSTYDNTLIFLNNYILQYPECKKYIQDNYVTVYLEFSEKKYYELIKNENLTELEEKLEKGVFKPRNKHFASLCDIRIKCKNKDKKGIIDSISKSLIKYYNKERKNEYSKKSSK